MSQFLLEIGSEEIPARMQAAAAAQLAKRFTDACAAAGLTHGAVHADATPRRLWLLAEDMAQASAATTEELKGPRADAPPQAIEGFLKKTGLTREALEERDTGKGVVLFAVLKREGRPASAILSEIIPALLTAFDWPKSMRWGAPSASTASPRWVRPLTHLVALLDAQVVPAEVHGLTASRTSRGHRIHAPGPLDITSANDWEQQLHAAHVIARSARRRQIIITRATELASAAGLTVLPDPGLEAENAGLTEWPVPLLGHFDPSFLAVPAEVIQLTMRTNQKYFACSQADGTLAPAFIAVANLDATDNGKAILGGNQRVLSARLSDAKFFWDQDLETVRKGGLEAFLPKLDQIVFHEKFGTIAEKVERVDQLARWLGGKLFPDAPFELFETAARLAKADLVSATVGEFPEVQGIAGGYLAKAVGFDPAVATAINEHYVVAGQGADLPAQPVSIALSLSDRFDTLCCFFRAGLLPTGSKDPFALRRAALTIIAIIQASGLRLPLREVLQQHNVISRQPLAASWVDDLLAFFADRLKVQQREAGVRPDVIDAVFALGEDDIVRLLARVAALQAFLATEDGTNLLAGYKRAANILKVEDAKDGPNAVDALDRELLTEPAELALLKALEEALPVAFAAIANEDFATAMRALSKLRYPVDTFFNDLMINDSDPAVRKNRLALLAGIRRAVQTVADFSRIEG